MAPKLEAVGNYVMAGNILNPLSAGQWTDRSSLIPGDIAQPDIVATGGGLLEDLPHVQPNVAVLTPQGFIDAALVNPTGWGGAMAQAIYFSATTGITAYAFEVDAALATACSVGSIVLQITDAGGSSILQGPTTCNLTSAFHTCTSGTVGSLVADTSYQAQILWNQGGSTGTCTGPITAAEALVSKIRVRPVTTSIPMLAGPFLRYAAAPELLWNNAADFLHNQGGAGVFRELSAMASFVFDTNALQIAIQTFNNYAPGSGPIGVLVDDAAFASVQPAFRVFDLNVVDLSSLPPGIHKVEVVSTGGSVEGDFVQSVIVPQTAYLKLRSPPLPGERWVIYSDSKCAGRAASVPPLTGYIPLLRRTLTGSVLSECWDGRSLAYDDVGFGLVGCDNTTDCSYLVSKLARDRPTKLINQIGRNDWGGPSLPPTFANVTVFQGMFGELLDLEHAAMPGVSLIAETTWLEGGSQETAMNLVGETLPQYRAAVQAACAAKPYCIFIDGTAAPDYFPNAGQMTIDNIHPNDEGNGVLANFEIAQLQAYDNRIPPFGFAGIALGAPTNMDTSGNVSIGAPYCPQLTVTLAGKPMTTSPQAVVTANATPTAVWSASTLTGSGGWLHATLVSRAITSGCGLLGDVATAEYVLGWKNVTGTVTLSTAGLTLLGAVQTTNASLTSTLTAAASSASIVLSVTNPAGCSVGSEVFGSFAQN